MHIAIIIPAYNEAALLSQTLESLRVQKLPATQIVVVDDNSTDNTFDIARSFEKVLPIKVIKNKSSAQNIPGSKVVRAFNKGLAAIDLDHFDIICKFDADLIFPPHYLEQIAAVFNRNIHAKQEQKLGMVAGHCVIKKNDDWVIENQNNPDHIRGALKAYTVPCFKAIGGLKTSIGWDTMDEMLARYTGWQVVTINDLHVKHLKPTGAAYGAKSLQLQGEAFYKMRYGVVLTGITAFKMAYKQKKWSLFTDYLTGYFKAKKNDLKRELTVAQGRFLRSYRWKGIKSKLGL